MFWVCRGWLPTIPVNLVLLHCPQSPLMFGCVYPRGTRFMFVWVCVSGLWLVWLLHDVHPSSRRFVCVCFHLYLSSSVIIFSAVFLGCLFLFLSLSLLSFPRNVALSGLFLSSLLLYNFFPFLKSSNYWISKSL